VWVIPSTLCPSVPERADSISQSKSLFEALASSFMWRGKHSPAIYWSRRWKKRAWMRRLSGRIFEPSTAKRFVASYLESLAGIRVNRSVSLDLALELPTIGGSGQMSLGLSASASPTGASSRTLPITSISDLTKSRATWKRWGTALRQASLQRRKSARPISASDCSFWPTATAQDSASSGAAGYSTESGCHPGTTLTDAVKLWTTPMAHDAQGPGNAARPGRSGTKHGGRNLNDHVCNWATPTARDWTDGDPIESVATNSLLGRQAPRITKDGLLSLLPEGWISSPLYLNPRFVEWLMGWPENWLCPELHESTSFAPAEMELWLSRQRRLLSGWLERQEWREVVAGEIKEQGKVSA
jgi:hypothetical protein